MLKRRFKRLTAFLLVIAMTKANICSVFASELEQKLMYNEALRQQLRGSDEDVANFPTGKMEFIASSMNASENLKNIEIMVVRKAGTEQSARVTFKAVDVTAAYGLDYIIKSDGFELFKGNPTVGPMVDYFLDNGNSQNSTTSGQGIGTQDDNILGDEQDTENPEDDSANTEQPENNINGNLSGLNQRDFPEIDTENKGTSTLSSGSLRALNRNFTGVASDRPDWKDLIEPNEAEIIKAQALDAVDQWAEDIEGVYGTLLFKPGEYYKKITLEIIDDKLSETDEQVLFLLTNPENCALGDVTRAYLNIQDYAFRMAECYLELRGRIYPIIIAVIYTGEVESAVDNGVNTD